MSQQSFQVPYFSMSMRSQVIHTWNSQTKIIGDLTASVINASQHLYSSRPNNVHVPYYFLFCIKCCKMQYYSDKCLRYNPIVKNFHCPSQTSNSRLLKLLFSNNAKTLQSYHLTAVHIFTHLSSIIHGPISTMSSHLCVFLIKQRSCWWAHRKTCSSILTNIISKCRHCCLSVAITITRRRILIIRHSSCKRFHINHFGSVNDHCSWKDFAIGAGWREECSKSMQMSIPMLWSILFAYMSKIIKLSAQKIGKQTHEVIMPTCTSVILKLCTTSFVSLYLLYPCFEFLYS